jgi:hypothetical protein
MRKFTLVGITATMASLFAQTSTATSRTTASADPEGVSSMPSSILSLLLDMLSLCSDREQRGSAVLGRTKQLLVIWHALAEHQAADIARLIEVDP